MGMRMDVSELTGYNTRGDYSMLLGSLPSRGGGVAGAANLNFLSDYASIKNGSYGKLMNAYYGPDKSRVSGVVNNSNSSISTSKDSAQQLKNIQSDADALKKSTDKLIETGAKSLFNTQDVTVTDANGVKSTNREFKTDDIYKAVSTFVNDYNNLLTKGSDSNSSSVLGKVNSLNGITNANKNMLDKVGITVGSDGRLSIDEETFKKADMTTAQSLFNGTGSYAYRVSAQASWIDFAATNEANRANTYTASGNFNNNFNTGNLFGSYF